ncbi:hypothetical protein CCR75_004759 [Bremia lactucae]|uniref:FYVE-type domain-containing protein n=1 Tax=Bremia lactucae TaxID=4779 RepID=A0A976IEC6_BRELC|nr:hypothetical protein CCR75_004759 [Bremia lactucae]
MPSATPEIDTAATAPDVKYAPITSSIASTATSFQTYSISDEDDMENPCTTIPSDACHAPRGQQASSFNVTLRTSYRDSLLPTPDLKTDLSTSTQSFDINNALMRMDESYGRAYTTSQRPSALHRSIEGLPPLLQAAQAGDIVLVNALIVQAGTDILRRDPMFGQTALHFAIRSGHLNVVQALLMPHLRGSIVNVADNRRNTALHLAAAKSRRMTKVLLDCGAEVNFLNMRNQTPLGVHILTVTRDDATLTEILLQHHANANAPVDKSTILHVALDKQLFQIATRLVRHGARLDQKDEQGKNVFEKVTPKQLKMLLAKVAHPPVWVLDSERLTCMECDKQFNLLRSRRHHCRMCGRVLCLECSAFNVRVNLLPFSLPRRGKKTTKVEKANTKTRVCKLCHDICVQDKVQPLNAHA